MNDSIFLFGIRDFVGRHSAIGAVTGCLIERRREPMHSVDIHSITADITAARTTFGRSPATLLD